MQVDRVDDTRFNWLTVVLQITTALFLAVMGFASLIALLLGTVALGYGNTFPGIVATVGGLVIGLLTLAAIAQIARRRVHIS